MYSILGDFVKKMPTIEKLYGKDMHILVNDVETVLMESFVPNSVNEDFVLSVRFCIGGAFRLLALEKDPIRIQKTVDLIERILSTEH